MCHHDELHPPPYPAEGVLGLLLLILLMLLLLHKY